MKRSFFSKIVGVKGRMIACAVVAALSAALMFVACQTDDPCTTNPNSVGCPGYVEPCPSTQVGCPGYVAPSDCDINLTPQCPNYCTVNGPTTECCAANPTYSGCTPADPCVTNPTPSCPGYCTANPTAAGCTPADPCVTNPTPSCPGYCTANPTAAGCTPADPCVTNPTPSCPGYCTANPTAAGCTPADPCVTNPTPSCPGYCTANPTAAGCTPADPCVTNPTPSCPGYCTANPTAAGCTPADPCVTNPTPSCPGYCTANPTAAGCTSGDTKYCYWTPNSYNDYTGSCVEIGGAYCTEASCQTEDGCTGSSGVIKTTSNCDGLPLTGNPCEIDPTPSCANYCEVSPTAAVCLPPTSKKWCYWAPNSYNDNKESCAEIGASTCEEASCKTEHGCEQSSGEVKTVANCGIVTPITGITTDSNANKTCLMSGAAMYCQWTTGCHEISETYSTPAGSTCQQLAENCYLQGKIYTGVTNVSADNEYGVGVTCNGTAYAK